MRYFIDTSFFVGIANTKDKYHSAAQNKLQELESLQNSELFTSDYVIDEFLSILIKSESIDEAIDWGKILYSQELSNIMYCNAEIHRNAWTILQDEVGERKPLNLTDCIIYVKQKLLKCDEILTFDSRLKSFDKPI